MGLETRFFVMRDDEMAEILPGWKRENPRLTTPIEHEGINPFTRELIRVRSWKNPEQPAADPDAVDSPQLRYQVVYWKWFTLIELRELEASVLGRTYDDHVNRPGEPELIGPEHAYGTLHAFESSVVKQLASADANRLRLWCEAFHAMRQDEYPEWSMDDLMELMRDLQRLARQAVDTKGRLLMHAGEP